jgi:1-deoxy-D-xylulose-5-phosphate reductoisomerase
MVTAPAPRPAQGAPQRITVLGATGSVGTSTLDLLAREPSRYAVAALTAGSNATELARLARQHSAQLAVVADPTAYATLKSDLSGSGIAAAAGPSGLDEAAACAADCTVAAIVGVAGLRPSLRAAEQGHRIALANKECLVSAGRLFMAAIRRHGAELLTVDSEHSGVLQTLEPHNRSEIARVTLTASGGPFRTKSRVEIEAATLEEALKHPNWSMGRKITIDSATMMNKGLELIEALHLFDLAPDQLAVLVHPQSIVHALVEYRDGAVLAQMASPDMRLPIALALTWPQRRPTPTPPLDLAKIATLTFEAPDETRFPALRLAQSAMRRGGGATAALNAANEAAVAAFLAKRCKFVHIAEAVERTLEHLDAANRLQEPADLDGVMALDAEARRVANEALTRFH